MRTGEAGAGSMQRHRFSASDHGKTKQVVDRSLLYLARQGDTSDHLTLPLSICG